jgi:hypothetical protein
MPSNTYIQATSCNGVIVAPSGYRLLEKWEEPLKGDLVLMDHSQTWREFLRPKCSFETVFCRPSGGSRTQSIYEAFGRYFKHGEEMRRLSRLWVHFTHKKKVPVNIMNNTLKEAKKERNARQAMQDYINKLIE